MVDDSNVLRGTASERRTKQMLEQRWKEYTSHIKEYEPPAREDLEHHVEETTKCGKCGGGIRAVMTEVQPSQAFAVDLEILVSLNCRDASCGWTSRQWRTWVRTKPLEL
jgi:bacterioferritin-associated ferredoxin